MSADTVVADTEESVPAGGPSALAAPPSRGSSPVSDAAVTYSASESACCC